MDIKNPYVFLLFKQQGRITVSEAWKEKFAAGHMADTFIIEDFSSAMNMAGKRISSYLP